MRTIIAHLTLFIGVALVTLQPSNAELPTWERKFSSDPGSRLEVIDSIGYISVSGMSIRFRVSDGEVMDTLLVPNFNMIGSFSRPDLDRWYVVGDGQPGKYQPFEFRVYSASDRVLLRTIPLKHSNEQTNSFGCFYSGTVFDIDRHGEYFAASFSCKEFRARDEFVSAYGYVFRIEADSVAKVIYLSKDRDVTFLPGTDYLSAGTSERKLFNVKTGANWAANVQHLSPLTPSGNAAVSQYYDKSFRVRLVEFTNLNPRIIYLPHAKNYIGQFLLANHIALMRPDSVTALDPYVVDLSRGDTLFTFTGANIDYDPQKVRIRDTTDVCLLGADNVVRHWKLSGLGRPPKLIIETDLRDTCRQWLPVQIIRGTYPFDSVNLVTDWGDGIIDELNVHDYDFPGRYHVQTRVSAKGYESMEFRKFIDVLPDTSHLNVTWKNRVSEKSSTDIALSPSGEQVAVCGPGQQIEVFSATNGLQSWISWTARAMKAIGWLTDTILVGSTDYVDETTSGIRTSRHYIGEIFDCPPLPRKSRTIWSSKLGYTDEGSQSFRVTPFITAGGNSSSVLLTFNAVSRQEGYYTDWSGMSLVASYDAAAVGSIRLETALIDTGRYIESADWDADKRVWLASAYDRNSQAFPGPFMRFLEIRTENIPTVSKKASSIGRVRSLGNGRILYNESIVKLDDWSIEDTIPLSQPIMPYGRNRFVSTDGNDRLVMWSTLTRDTVWKSDRLGARILRTLHGRRNGAIICAFPNGYIGAVFPPKSELAVGVNEEPTSGEERISVWPMPLSTEAVVRVPRSGMIERVQLFDVLGLRYDVEWSTISDDTGVQLRVQVPPVAPAGAYVLRVFQLGKVHDVLVHIAR